MLFDIFQCKIKYSVSVKCSRFLYKNKPVFSENLIKLCDSMFRLAGAQNMGECRKRFFFFSPSRLKFTDGWHQQYLCLIFSKKNNIRYQKSPDPVSLGPYHRFSQSASRLLLEWMETKLNKSLNKQWVKSIRNV